MNIYRYVGNGVIISTDPTGLDAVIIVTRPAGNKSGASTVTVTENGRLVGTFTGNRNENDRKSLFAPFLQLARAVSSRGPLNIFRSASAPRARGIVAGRAKDFVARAERLHGDDTHPRRTDLHVD